MDLRREVFGAAVKLAMVLSVVAGAIVVSLGTVGGTSRMGLVLAVIVVGFVASWVQTGRVWRSNAETRRLAVVPLRHPVS